jgi:hypothetical protein
MLKGVNCLFRGLLRRGYIALCVLLFLTSTAHSVLSAEGFSGWFADAPEPENKWGAMVFGGQMNDAKFGETLDPFTPPKRVDIWFTGVAVNRYIANWRFLNFEVEGGTGYQWGENSDNNTAQVWMALYARYGNFPWNKWVKTTVGANIGVNYSFHETQHEENNDPDLGTRKLLHYLAPEITFADPRHDNIEAVFRLHHRSHVAGTFGCHSCGSNMVTAGVRVHF